VTVAVYRFFDTVLHRKDTMRKTLEAISLGALALLVWVTWSALAGPGRLPDRIPTHFDVAGNPNGWGSPAMLLLLPVVAVAIYLVMTVVSRFPSSFNCPVRVTEENRVRLQQQTLDMLAWLKAELACLFAWMQWSIIQLIQNGHGRLSPVLMPGFLIVIFGTIGWYFVAMVRTARPGGGS
jgi:uncharacterized membrane protein